MRRSFFVSFLANNPVFSIIFENTLDYAPFETNTCSVKPMRETSAEARDQVQDAPAAVRAAQDRFVAIWGQMSGAWGISRTMAEVHALLYITGEPMCTDDIMDRLAISRGNASMSIRSLLDWGIAERSHKRGDRKDYFESEQEVWALFRAIVRERVKREVDPLVASLHELRDETSPLRVKSPDVKLREVNERLQAMVDFFETLEELSQRFVTPPGRGLRIAASLLGSLVGIGSKENSQREKGVQQ